MSNLVKQFIVGEVIHYKGERFVPLSIRTDKEYSSGYCVKVHLLESKEITEIDLQFVTDIEGIIEQKVAHVEQLIESYKSNS